MDGFWERADAFGRDRYPYRASFCNSSRWRRPTSEPRPSTAATSSISTRSCCIPPPYNEPITVSTLNEAERDHILRALEATGWRINGPKGAAAILKLHPSTLRFRMKKLRLTKTEGAIPPGYKSHLQ